MNNSKDELNNLIKELEINLPKEIDETISGGRKSTISKALNIRAGLMYRAYDLSCSSLLIIECNLVSGKLLARSLFETSAMLAYLNLKINTFIKTKNLEKFNEKLEQLLLGSRIGEEPISINVMDFIRSVEKQVKELEGFENYFDTLCEFAHPNFSGTSGSFGRLEVAKTTYSLIPDDFEQQKKDTINALCFGLNVLKYFSLEIYDNTDKLIEIYNEVIENP